MDTVNIASAIESAIMSNLSPRGKANAANRVFRMRLLAITNAIIDLVRDTEAGTFTTNETRYPDEDPLEQIDIPTLSREQIEALLRDAAKVSRSEFERLNPIDPYSSRSSIGSSTVKPM